MVNQLTKEIETNTALDGVICIFDQDFPLINPTVKAKGDRPYLLFYKGDISLLHHLNNNVAVIGHTSPSENIQKRERKIVSQLVKEEQVIVSGLAKGCDVIAHEECMRLAGKTIAILPSPINEVLPKEHTKQAKQIVETGGLLISEYYTSPSNPRFEMTKRYIERDRLQAMFAKVVILIASYAVKKGDSGARHAMNKALKYKHQACVMYDEKQDSHVDEMELNKQFVEAGSVKVLAKAARKNPAFITIDEIAKYRISTLERVTSTKQDNLF
ncbi:MAG: DNA-processing protein DprA [Veillonella sp.]|nr:DNA-processing protein DprA [Veillonella parvula]MBS6333204.1 DNA-processing protein DprA [Veillonella sp.]